MATTPLCIHRSLRGFKLASRTHSLAAAGDCIITRPAHNRHSGHALSVNPLFLPAALATGTAPSRPPANSSEKPSRLLTNHKRDRRRCVTGNGTPSQGTGRAPSGFDSNHVTSRGRPHLGRRPTATAHALHRRRSFTPPHPPRFAIDPGPHHTGASTGPLPAPSARPSRSCARRDVY